MRSPPNTGTRCIGSPPQAWCRVSRWLTSPNDPPPPCDRSASWPSPPPTATPGTPCARPGGRRSPTPTSAARCARSPAGSPRSASVTGDRVGDPGRHACRSGRWPTSARCARARRSCPSTTRTRPRSASTCSRTRARRSILLEDAAQAAKIASVRDALPELEHVDRADRRGRGRDHARRPALARRRRGRRGRARAGRRGRPRRRGDDRLHVRHDRAAEGLRAHAREPAVHRERVHRPAGAARRAAGDLPRTCRWRTCWRGWCRSSTLDTGGTLAFWGGDTKNLAADIAEAQPTHIPTVPRLLEKIHTRVIGTAAAAGGAKAAIFTRALATGEKVAQGASARAGRSARSTARATPSATSSRCRRSAPRSAPTTRS